MFICILIIVIILWNYKPTRVLDWFNKEFLFLFLYIYPVRNILTWKLYDDLGRQNMYPICGETNRWTGVNKICPLPTIVFGHKKREFYVNCGCILLILSAYLNQQKSLEQFLLIWLSCYTCPIHIHWEK